MTQLTKLVHIPANTILEKLNSDGVTVEYMETDKPCVALMVEQEKNNKCRVYHDSRYWTCRSRDVYEVKK